MKGCIPILSTQVLLWSKMLYVIYISDKFRSKDWQLFQACVIFCPWHKTFLLQKSSKCLKTKDCCWLWAGEIVACKEIVSNKLHVIKLNILFSIEGPFISYTKWQGTGASSALEQCLLLPCYLQQWPSGGTCRLALQTFVTPSHRHSPAQSPQDQALIIIKLQNMCSPILFRSQLCFFQQSLLLNKDCILNWYDFLQYIFNNSQNFQWLSLYCYNFHEFMMIYDDGDLYFLSASQTF